MCTKFHATIPAQKDGHGSEGGYPASFSPSIRLTYVPWSLGLSPCVRCECSMFNPRVRLAFAPANRQGNARPYTIRFSFAALRCGSREQSTRVQSRCQAIGSGFAKHGLGRVQCGVLWEQPSESERGRTFGWKLSMMHGESIAGLRVKHRMKHSL